MARHASVPADIADDFVSPFIPDETWSFAYSDLICFESFAVDNHTGYVQLFHTEGKRTFAWEILGPQSDVVASGNSTTAELGKKAVERWFNRQK